MDRRFTTSLGAFCALAVLAGVALAHAHDIRAAARPVHTNATDRDDTSHDTRARRHDRHPRRVIIVYADRSARADPTPPEPVPPAPPPAPPQPAETAERPRLDPAGGNRLRRARNAPDAQSPVRVGAPLPAWIPHVTLNPQHYDLPPAPPGQIYARIRQGVFLIDAESRRVRATVQPGTGG